jgi:hypothetical protein
MGEIATNRTGVTRDAAGNAKKRYQQPALKVYGSVQALTGSGTQNVPGEYNPGNMPLTMVGNMASDRSLKHNIVRIGEHPLGIGLYLFDYRPEYHDRLSVDRQFGVMADEVEAVMPQAVGRHTDGYKMVNYAMLGVRPTRH